MDYEISEKVFQVKAKPIGDLHLKDVEFEVIVYICPENVAVIKKEDMIKNDDDSYYGLITTEIAKQIGVGNVKGINVNGKEYNAAAGGGYIPFAASDPATVTVDATEKGVVVGFNNTYKGTIDAAISDINNVKGDYIPKSYKTTIEGLVSAADDKAQGAQDAQR